MRLIDADKLRKDFLDLPNCCNGFSDTYDKATIIDVVDEQPIAKAIPIAWIRKWTTQHSPLSYVAYMLLDWKEENEID